MMTIRGIAMGALAGVVACGGSTEPDDDNPLAIRNVSGRTDRTIVVDGQQRQFVVYVGTTAGATDSVPVIIMMHGTSGDGPRFYEISGWRQKADQEGLIAVFPSALEYCFYEDENRDGDFEDAGERKITSKWTHGELGQPGEMPLCTAQVIASLPAQTRALVDHPLRDDVLFIDNVISFLKQNYLIDDKRIYVSGFSNGAQMSNRLAVERSTVFAATAAHAGGTSVPTPGTARQMSIVSSVGTVDDRFTGPLGVTEIPLRSTTLEELPLLGGIMVLPLINQLRLTQAYTYGELTIAGKRVGRWDFTSGIAGSTTSSLTFLLFEGNLHTYPNGDNYAVVMANVLWEFFRTKTLP